MESSGVWICDGYKNSARWVWLAMIATWLAWLNAKWALIKTRRFAIALPNGRESESRAHAFGLVSRIIVRRVGGGSIEGIVRIQSALCARCQTIGYFGIMI